jgi:hypothetical protein
MSKKNLNETEICQNFGHYFAYRQGAGGRGQSLMLWIATPVSLALWVVPWMLR